MKKVYKEDVIKKDGSVKTTPFYDVFDYKGYGVNFEETDKLNSYYEIKGEPMTKLYPNLIRNATLITKPEGSEVISGYENRVAIINEMLTTDPSHPEETHSVYRSVLTILDEDRQKVSYKVLDIDIAQISFSYSKRRDSSKSSGYEYVHDVVMVTKQDHVYFYSDDSKIEEKYRIKELVWSNGVGNIPIELRHAKLIPVYPTKELDHGFR